MNPIRSIASSSRFRAVSAMLVLFVATGEAAAAKKAVEDVTAQATFTGTKSNGTSWSFDKDPLLDTNAEEGIPATAGDRFIVDFSPVLTAEEPMMYVDEITIEHVTARKYSLYVSTNYAPASPSSAAWTPVATNVTNSGRVAHKRQERIKAIKYVFENANGTKEDLCGFHVTGFRSSEPKVVSKWSYVTMKNILWGANTFGGGTGNPANVFNETFGDYQMLPRTYNLSYFQICVTNDYPAGAFITKIIVDSKKKYTLKWSDDAQTWDSIDGASGVTIQGKTTIQVDRTAKYIGYFFDEAGDGSYSDEFIAEIQVWGMNSDDVPCTHPGWTDWTPSIPATCTERAQEERFCVECGLRATKFSEGLPLGHSYIVTLDHQGRWTPRKMIPDRRCFGSGSISCSNCNFRLEFPTAIDLTTNRVAGIPICGIKAEGVVRFADLSVSSTDHPGWGPADLRLIDNYWRMPYANENLWTYWVSIGLENQWIDYEFGTEIDLVAIDLSVRNRNYTLRFCNLDDDTGRETIIGEIPVVYDETGNGIKKTVVVDPETGAEIEIEVEVHADYQRMLIPFFTKTIKHLRTHVIDETGTDLGWGNGAGVCVIEIHPWGTVPGASDFQTDKTTIVIFR